MIPPPKANPTKVKRLLMLRLVPKKRYTIIARSTPSRVVKLCVIDIANMTNTSSIKLDNSPFFTQYVSSINAEIPKKAAAELGWLNVPDALPSTLNIELPPEYVTMTTTAGANANAFRLKDIDLIDI